MSKKKTRTIIPTTRAYTDDARHFARIARQLADWLCHSSGKIDIADNGVFVTQLERVAKSGAYNRFQTPLELKKQDGVAVLHCRSKSARFVHPLHGNASDADWHQVRIDAAEILRECADDAERPTASASVSLATPVKRGRPRNKLLDEGLELMMSEGMNATQAAQRVNRGQRNSENHITGGSLRAYKSKMARTKPPSRKNSRKKRTV